MTVEHVCVSGRRREIWALLKNALLFVSGDVSRPILNSVGFDDGLIVATDSFGLFWREGMDRQGDESLGVTVVRGASSNDGLLLVPAGTVKEAVKLLAGPKGTDDDLVSVAFASWPDEGRGRVTVTRDGGEIASASVAPHVGGDFPLWRSLVPEDDKLHVGQPFALSLGQLKRLGSLTDGQRGSVKVGNKGGAGSLPIVFESIDELKPCVARVGSASVLFMPFKHDEFDLAAYNDQPPTIKRTKYVESCSTCELEGTTGDGIDPSVVGAHTRVAASVPAHAARSVTDCGIATIGGV